MRWVAMQTDPITSWAVWSRSRIILGPLVPRIIDDLNLDIQRSLR